MGSRLDGERHGRGQDDCGDGREDDSRLLHGATLGTAPGANNRFPLQVRAPCRWMESAVGRCHVALCAIRRRLARYSTRRAVNDSFANPIRSAVA